MVKQEVDTTATGTRCYWAILDSSMAFQYLDPVFQQHMKQQANSMLGKQLTDFIHPDENLVAQEDFAKFQSSGIIFGSVTRCRYAKISHCRKILGADEVKQENADDQWISARITSSLVAPNTVLAFFHAITEDVDASAAADGNDCGPTSAEVSGDLFNSDQIDMLTKAFTSCQAESEDVKAKIADQTFKLKTDPFPPPYVFQLLATGTDNIIFTWPPARGTGDDADTAANGPTPENGERYQPVECAALARSVALPTGGADAGEASTNCTKRYQSKHPVMDGNVYTNVESVVITYQGLTIVCFRSGGLTLNRNIFSAPDLSVTENSSTKRKDVSDPAEDEAIKRIRTANLQHDSGDMPVPNVESLNTNWHPVPSDGQQFTDIPHSPGMGGNTQVPQWNPDDPNSANSLQSPYYGAYPSVYSNMFSNDGRSSGFMGGSTNIPPMPAPSQPSGSNGLANLALASSSSYYTDYNKQGQFPQGTGQDNQIPVSNQSNGNNIPTGSDVPPSPATPALSSSEQPQQPVVHRVRKNDRGRICTSCGTTNSPEWRKGPSGIKTLCNACGLRYSRAQTRKLKKAQKQQDAESQAVPNSADGSFVSTGGGPHDPYGALPPKPIQIPNSASTATGPTSAGTPHSPFMPIGDYSVHAPLPPLPTPAQDDPPHSAGSTSDNIPTGATGNGNYGAYGNYVNYAFDQWGSPTQNSFSQGQQPGN